MDKSLNTQDPDFAVPYTVQTVAPPLPMEVAALLGPDGTRDAEKVTALSTEELTRAYWLAAFHAQKAKEAFNKEIRWLESATRSVESEKAVATYPNQVLEEEWEARRVGKTVTWQGIRKTLTAVGFVVKEQRSWNQKAGPRFETYKNSDTEVQVRFDDIAGLRTGRIALEAAGYTIREARERLDHYFTKSALVVVKLKPGQTLADLQRGWVPDCPEDLKTHAEV